jgi:hypothetical protein
MRAFDRGRWTGRYRRRSSLGRSDITRSGRRRLWPGCTSRRKRPRTTRNGSRGAPAHGCAGSRFRPLRSVAARPFRTRTARGTPRAFSVAGTFLIALRSRAAARTIFTRSRTRPTARAIVAASRTGLASRAFILAPRSRRTTRAIVLAPRPALRARAIVPLLWPSAGSRPILPALRRPPAFACRRALGVARFAPVPAFVPQLSHDSPPNTDHGIAYRIPSDAAT